MSFSQKVTRHSGPALIPASVRVALIGDSMTYGTEVRCEETWGHVLEGLLQPEVQILNFGVPAYGLNQTYLRYEKDVRPWNPEIVVIGISSAMIERMNNIYPFLMNPRLFAEIVHARPRLIMGNGVPSITNYPVPEPKQRWAQQSIQDLPQIELDAYYRPSQWERGGIWSVFERSYLFRFFNSLRPPMEANSKDVRREAGQAGQALLQYLIREVERNGSIPLVVWLPYVWEWEALPLPLRNAERWWY